MDKIKLGLFFAFMGIFNTTMAEVILHEDDWAPEMEVSDSDAQSYGSEDFRDLTDWKNIDASKWTSFSDWKKQRAAKDKLPEWRTLIRNFRAREIIGRVIKCVGECSYYRGLNLSAARTLSILREGDEFLTGATGQAWIMLVDGTLLRVSAKTSLTLNEVNLSLKEVSFLIRVNSGHVQFQSRLLGSFEKLDRVESDLSFSPVLIKRANREFYAIKEYRKLSSQEKLSYATVPNAGFSSQYDELNMSLAKNKDKLASRNSKILFYTANVSLFTQNSHGSLFYSPRGKSIYKLEKNIKSFVSSDRRVQRIRRQQRGYETTSLEELSFGQWYETDSKGESSRKLYRPADALIAVENFLNRIPMIQLARESFLDRYSLDLLSLNKSAQELARDHGYRLWDNTKRPELFLREAYLKEYIRRTETTNLKSFEKLSEKLEPFDFERSFYEVAMKKHYKKLKSLYSLENLNIRKLSMAEFYFWILRENNE